MASVLITGANRGLGLEFARQYAGEGWRVFATCRDPARAEALRRLSGEITVHRLDVGKFDEVRALAGELDSEPIDLLINNAGVYGGRPQDLESLDYGVWAEVLRIDCVAQIHVAHAFLEPVARSSRKIIVAMSSGMGSIADNTSGGAYIYRSSKAALNAAMKSLAIDLAPKGITVAVLHPGWAKTEMGGAGALIGADESVAGMRAVIDRLGPADAGGFFRYDGSTIPW
jgi:NAD(P)-dependent dehydrogenase (short-subunit alcohol dehydrogenase family)